MPRERINHEFFFIPGREILEETDNWFAKYGIGVSNGIFSIPDVAVSRFLISRMLCEAWNSEEFFRENGMLRPEPDELDRMKLITWLQQIASLSGLLSGEEIRLIQENEGMVNTSIFQLEDKPQLAFKNLSELEEGW